MFKRFLAITALVVCIIDSAQAQEKQRKAYRPDIPGFFLVDLGLNFPLSPPANFNQGFWGSRTLNLYYHYPVRIAESNFSFNPGAGFSFERFKMTNNYTCLLYTSPSPRD